MKSGVGILYLCPTAKIMNGPGSAAGGVPGLASSNSAIGKWILCAALIDVHRPGAQSGCDGLHSLSIVAVLLGNNELAFHVLANA